MSASEGLLLPPRTACEREHRVFGGLGTPQHLGPAHATHQQVSGDHTHSECVNLTAELRAEGKEAKAAGSGLGPATEQMLRVGGSRVHAPDGVGRGG